MPLIKSISGIRGTLGDLPGENLTKKDVINFTKAFAFLIKEKAWGNLVIIGRDARPSGLEFSQLITETFLSLGFQVLDLGLATTPTLELATIHEKAAGGIMISASHNPIEWNALKLINNEGEFLSAQDGERLLELSIKDNYDESQKDRGKYSTDSNYGIKHIDLIEKLAVVDFESIKKANFKIVVDGINSVGGLIIPQLLEKLGVRNIIKINCEPDGRFAHNPEPLEKNLVQLAEAVVSNQADLGLVVDPDVDRLAFINEKGQMFGEEYTLVAVADHVLRNYCPCFYQKISVSNLSSSRALKDVTEKHGGSYYAAAVGEVNVVAQMKKTKAVIGGEGNGGVILPELHYGRDALVGTALFLSALAQSGQKMSDFKQNFPEYFMIKDKLELNPSINVQDLLTKIKMEYQRAEYGAEKITDIDGVKIDWPEYWLHLRASNTEPIIRLYGEAKNQALLELKIREIKENILAYIKG